MERPGNTDQRLSRIVSVEDKFTGRYYFEWGKEEGRGELEDEEEDEQSRMIDRAYRHHISNLLHIEHKGPTIRHGAHQHILDRPRDHRHPEHMKPANSQQARRKVQCPWFRVFIRRQDESKGLTCVKRKSVGRDDAPAIWERMVSLSEGFGGRRDVIPVDDDGHRQRHKRHEHCKQRHPT